MASHFFACKYLEMVLSSAGFSLRVLVLARPNPRRLKPALLNPNHA